MRKVTREVVGAFLDGKKKAMGNTATDGARLFLHGNLIACKRLTGQEVDGLYITNSGWASNTTKERLNALPGVSISQKNFEWYLNGKKWNGELIKIR